MYRIINLLVLLFLIFPIAVKSSNIPIYFEARADTFHLWQFINCSKDKYEGKKQKSISDSVSIYTSMGSKIYIFRDYYLGFLTDWNNINEAKEIYNSQNNLIKVLFENGLITAEMILKEILEQTSVTNLDSLPTEKRIVKILNIREITDSLKTKRKFKYKLFEIWVTLRLDDDGWGGFPVLYLLLENDEADKNSSLPDFIKSSIIKCFQYGYLQI